MTKNKCAVKAAKFDDVQIKNGALEQEGKKIVAHLQKVREYEAAAKEKAGHEFKKADEHFVSLTQELAAVKAKCKGAGFAVFKEKYCPDLSRSRIYQLLEIGSGKKTLEQSRAEKRESVAKSRAPKMSTTGAPVVDEPAVGLGNGEALPSLDRFSDRVKEQTTDVAGNATETGGASAEERKAENAAALYGASVATFADTPEAKSKRALMAGQSWLDDNLRDMNSVDKAELFRFFKFHRAMLGVPRSTA